METAPRRIGLATLYALCLAPAPGKVAGILGPGACRLALRALARRLPAALSRSRARVALVLALPEAFADEDVPYPEACRVFRSCLSALRRLSREGTRVVVTGEGGGGHSSPLAPGKTKTEECPPKRPGFLRYLARTSDPLLMLGNLAGGGHSTLHPRRVERRVSP